MVSFEVVLVEILLRHKHFGSNRIPNRIKIILKILLQRKFFEVKSAEFDHSESDVFASGDLTFAASSRLSTLNYSIEVEIKSASVLDHVQTNLVSS